MENFNELIKDCKTIKEACKKIFGKDYVNTTLSKQIHALCAKNGYTWREHIEKFKQPQEKKYCLFCGKELDVENRDPRVKFCDSSCAAKYNNSIRVVSDETKEKISITLKGQNKFNNVKTVKRVYTLKERLFKNGTKEYKCECCGISEWNYKPISLQLHHINGNHNDNRLENLQILCPNCHSQTDTFCHKNRKVGNKKQDFFCEKCGKKLTEERKTKLCSECFRKQVKENSKCPSREELAEKMKTNSANSILAREYGVSTSTIRKWLLNYNLY